MVQQLQTAMDTVRDKLASVGLELSANKTDAMLVHPDAAARGWTRGLTIDGDKLQWRTRVRYLGLTLDHRLNFRQAARELRARAQLATTAVHKIVARGSGCSQQTALRLYSASAVGLLLYALPLVSLRKPTWRQLEGDHRKGVRACLGLSRCSQSEKTLAEAGAWTLEMMADQRALGHIDRLRRAEGGGPLLQRLRGYHHSRMGRMLALYEEVVAPVDAGPGGPAPALKADVRLDIPGLHSKRRTPHCGQLQLARGVVWGDLHGHTLVYTDGSVRQQQGSAAAAAVLGENTRQVRLPYAASSATAELVGISLGLDLLREVDPLPERCALLCDSRVALMRLRDGDPHSLLVRGIREKAAQMADQGTRLRLQWVPAHIGLDGNERADELAAGAHAMPPSNMVAQAAADDARLIIQRHLRTRHPDPRLGAGEGPPPVRASRLPRQLRSTVLRLRVGDVWTAERRHRLGLVASPVCTHCRAPVQSLPHVLYECPKFAAGRAELLAVLRGVRPLHELLWPPGGARERDKVLEALGTYLGASGLHSALRGTAG